MPTRYDLDRDALAALLGDEPRYRFDQVWDGLHRTAPDPVDLPDLPKALRARLSDEPALKPALTLDAESVSDGGDTVKWLWRLGDDTRIETVLMHYRDRSTVCVS